jgi:outer membrane protein assembly factor BamB
MTWRKAAVIGLASLILAGSAPRVFGQEKKPEYVFWPMKRFPLIAYAGRINVGGFVSGDKLYLTTTASLVYAFDLVQMKPIWQFKTKAPISFPPVVAGGLAIAVDDRGEIYALDEKGRAAWTLATGEPPIAGPILLGDKTLIFRKAGDFFVLNWRTKKIEGTFAAAGRVPIDSWRMAEGLLYAVLRNGAIVVLGPEAKEMDRIESDTPYRGPLAVSKETILVGKDGGIIEAFDRNKRKPRWEKRLGPAFRAIEFMGEKRICALGTNDVLFCLARRTGDLMWWRGGDVLETPVPLFWRGRIAASFGTGEIFGLVDRTGESRYRFDVFYKIIADFQTWRENMIVHLYSGSDNKGYLQLMGPDVPAKSP